MYSPTDEWTSKSGENIFCSYFLSSFLCRSAIFQPSAGSSPASLGPGPARCSSMAKGQLLMHVSHITEVRVSEKCADVDSSVSAVVLVSSTLSLLLCTAHPGFLLHCQSG